MGLLDLFRSKGAKIQRVSAPQALNIVRDGAQFIDVRNRREFKAGHAQGARNIALNTLPNVVDKLDKDAPIVVICQSGMRSGKACQVLVREGFSQVYNVGGGSTAWHGHGLPWE